MFLAKRRYLWEEIERDIDFCYGDSSDNVIQNVFLDSVASSTPARHPEFGNDIQKY